MPNDNKMVWNADSPWNELSGSTALKEVASKSGSDNSSELSTIVGIPKEEQRRKAPSKKEVFAKWSLDALWLFRIQTSFFPKKIRQYRDNSSNDQESIRSLNAVTELIEIQTECNLEPIAGSWRAHLDFILQDRSEPKKVLDKLEEEIMAENEFVNQMINKVGHWLFKF